MCFFLTIIISLKLQMSTSIPLPKLWIRRRLNRQQKTHPYKKIIKRWKVQRNVDNIPPIKPSVCEDPIIKTPLPQDTIFSSAPQQRINSEEVLKEFFPDFQLHTMNNAPLNTPPECTPQTSRYVPTNLEDVTPTNSPASAVVHPSNSIVPPNPSQQVNDTSNQPLFSTFKDQEINTERNFEKLSISNGQINWNLPNLYIKDNENILINLDVIQQIGSFETLNFFKYIHRPEGIVKNSCLLYSDTYYPDRLRIESHNIGFVVERIHDYISNLALLSFRKF